MYLLLVAYHKSDTNHLVEWTQALIGTELAGGMDGWTPILYSSPPYLLACLLVPSPA